MTSSYVFSPKSRKVLADVVPELRLIAETALKISTIDFAVTEGRRTVDRQTELFRNGQSWTMNSSHLTGHAIDIMAIVNGKGSWEWENYVKIAEAFFNAARDLNKTIEWGGNWKVKDGVHFQLLDKRNKN